MPSSVNVIKDRIPKYPTSESFSSSRISTVAPPETVFPTKYEKAEDFGFFAFSILLALAHMELGLSL